MAHCFDAMVEGHVFGKLIVYDDGLVEPRAEAYIDGGDHWNVYEPTRRQAADLLKLWRRIGFRIERDDT